MGFEGVVEFDASKPDGTMRKLIDMSRLHSLGWTHKVEIEDGVKKLFEWFKKVWGRRFLEIDSGLASWGVGPFYAPLGYRGRGNGLFWSF